MALHILLSGKIWRICSDCLRDNRQLMAGEVQKIYIFLHGKLNEIMITTTIIIIIIIIIMVVGAFGKRVKIFITKPQLKSYLQSTCCYKKSN